MSLLWTIETHLFRTGTAPSRFGRKAVNDPRLVADMRNGRIPSQRTVRRLNAYMASIECARP